MLKFVTVFILLIGYFAYTGDLSFGFSSADIQVYDDGVVTVDSGSKYFEYEPDSEVSYSSYRVVDMLRPHSSMKDFGIEYQLALLTEEDYGHFESIQASGNCPASFLNQHATMLFLIVSPETKDSVDRQEVKAGDSVSLEGVEMTYGYGEINGNELTKVNNFTPVLLKNLTVN